MRPLANVTSLLSLNAVLENSTTTQLPPSLDLSLYAPRTPLNDTVFAKVRQVLRSYRSAAFRELSMTSEIGPTTDPELLLDVRLLFSWGPGSIYVDMTDVWGTWDDPRPSATPYPREYNSLPARLRMDVVFADRLMKKAGYRGRYEAADAKWPKGLRLGSDQPYYYFLMEGSQPDFVYVGVNDHTVLTSLPMIAEVAEDNVLTEEQ